MHFTDSRPTESTLKTEYCSQVFNSMQTFKFTAIFKNATHLNRKINNLFFRSILSCRELGTQHTITIPEHFLGVLGYSCLDKAAGWAIWKAQESSSRVKVSRPKQYQGK